jgi:hypothetical protein
MNTQRHSIEKIAVFFCKDFPTVVRRIRCKEPISHLETAHTFVDGYSDSNGDIHIPEEQSNFIREKVVSGHTVTGYLRLSDNYGFIPVSDELEKSAAKTVNDKILEKLFLENLPN